MVYVVFECVDLFVLFGCFVVGFDLGFGFWEFLVLVIVSSFVMVVVRVCSVVLIWLSWLGREELIKMFVGFRVVDDGVVIGVVIGLGNCLV